MERYARDRRITGEGWLRGGLLLVAAPQILTGLWALCAPRSFYDDYPLAGRGWISALGPYNEHLVRDVGAGLLSLGMLVALTSFLLERRLVQVSLGVWLVFAVPHFDFHLTTFHTFSTTDYLEQVGGLGFLVLLHLVLLVHVSRAGYREESETASGNRKVEHRG
jgi:hypothetical protein